MGRGLAGKSFWRRSSIAAIFLAAFLPAPVSAAAAEYTVDSTGDQADEAPGSSGCETAAETCTLRAAIEESNASAGINDTIKFSAFFDGQITDTINLAASLPTVTDRARIEGFPSPLRCQTDYLSLPGPCVGIDGPPGGPAFSIAAERVVLIGFAVSGAQTAIEAVDAPGLEAWNNWLGVKLDGSAGSNGTGVFVDQDSNGPLIGGSSPIARNVIANSTSHGLDMDGADNAVIRGNYFGVDPTGMAPMANGDNIEITDAISGANRDATGNQIGGTLNASAVETPTCDGACNLISGATSNGVDMEGVGLRAAPTGPTTIQGNYVGLNADGSAVVPNGASGILIGGGNDALIGGEAVGDANLINGGNFGVRALNVRRLVVEGNAVGVDPTGSVTMAPPTESGIFIGSGDITDEEDAALVLENVVAMNGGTGGTIYSGTGITMYASGGLVAGNEIGVGSLSGGAVGLLLYGGGSFGSLVAENAIQNASKNGLRIHTSHNLIVANLIQGSGAAGIRLTSGTGNEIGGHTEADENAILENGSNAIEVVETNIEQNKFGRNFGWSNSGLFVDLGGDGPGNSQFGPNDGMQTPSISSAIPSGASGSGARSEATILVFRKDTGSQGEIDSFLGEAPADQAGDWSLAYANPIPEGTVIAASQTAFEGTSEFALSTTKAEPDSVDGEGDTEVAVVPAQLPTVSPPASLAGTAFVRGRVFVKGNRVLVRVICRRGLCGGVLKVFARVPAAGGRKARGGRRASKKRARLALIGKRRLRVAAGTRKVLRIPLNRRGRALVRRASRRGLRVRLGGRGVKSRAARVRRPTARAK